MKKHPDLDLSLWFPQGRAPKDIKINRISRKRDLGVSIPALDVEVSIGLGIVHSGRVSRPCLLRKKQGH